MVSLPSKIARIRLYVSYSLSEMLTESGAGAPARSFNSPKSWSDSVAIDGQINIKKS